MDKYIRPQYAFVFFAIIFGFLLMFLTPPFQSPDEPAHFAKSVSFAQGHFISQKINNVSGDFLPESILTFEKHFDNLFFNTDSRITVQQIEQSKNVKFEENKKIFVNQKYHAMYSPLAYVPQGIGVFAAKHFTDSVYWIMIGAKLCLLFFYIIMGYFSIKSIPFCKWLTFLILMMPMSLSLGVSVSADAVLIAVSVLFFAKILQYSYQENNLNNKQIMALTLFCISLALIKQSVLLSLFVLFIPKTKFGEKYFVKLACILVPAFISALIWSKFSYSLFVPMNGSNPEIQTKFILEHPFIFIATLLKTIKAYFLALIYSTIGILGWLDVFMFPFMYWIYLILLGANAVLVKDSNEKILSSVFQKILLFGLCLLNFVVICTIIYVSWAVPYLISPFEGLQGRYFIPLLLPLFVLLFLIFNKQIKINRPKWLPIFNIIFVCLAYLNIFFGLFIRYYALF